MNPNTSVGRWWYALTDVEKLQVVGGGVMAFSFLGLRGTALCALCAGILSQRKPSNVSFLVYFEHWFKDVFVPEMSTKLALELAQRAQRRRSILESLKDSATSWLVDNSKALQTALLWDTVSARALPTIIYRDLFFMRTASINLGSPEEPMVVVFWGAADCWFLSPFVQMNFDGVSVLAALEGRG
jgi:hypothetical protein